MTEEIRKRPDSIKESSNQASGQENPSKLIVRTLTISSVFLAYTIFDSMFQFREFGAWQILADAGGILIALVLLLVSLFFHRNGKTEQGNDFIPFVILFGYAPGDLFLEGVTLYNLGSGILLFAHIHLNHLAVGCAEIDTDESVQRIREIFVDVKGNKLASKPEIMSNQNRNTVEFLFQIRNQIG